MKTIQEQIAVMQHFAAGGKVKSTPLLVPYWEENTDPAWNWIDFDYDIMEEDPYAELKKAAADPTKQVKIKGWSNWVDSGYPWSWNLHQEHYEIRDKPKPMKKIKLLAWFDGNALFWRAEGYNADPDWDRFPHLDLEGEVADD